MPHVTLSPMSVCKYLVEGQLESERSIYAMLVNKEEAAMQELSTIRQRIGDCRKQMLVLHKLNEELTGA